MTPDQITLALYRCRTCGVELEYQGVGRPPAYCLEHRPASFPPLKGRPATPQQLNGSRSRGPLARAGDPVTSHEAAASVDGAAVEARILAAFDQFGWLNCSECAEIIDAYLPTVVSAVSRLRRAGELVDTNTTRPSLRGRPSILWARPGA